MNAAIQMKELLFFLPQYKWTEEEKNYSELNHNMNPENSNFMWKRRGVQ